MRIGCSRTRHGQSVHQIEVPSLGHMTLTMPSLGVVCHPYLLCSNYLNLKASPIPEVKDDQKFTNRDGLERLGSPESSIMSRFDRAHVTSYLVSIVTMYLSGTVSETRQVTDRKLQIVPTPRVFGAPCG